MASRRRGITPVVAFVLLILLIVSLVGGFGAWYLQTQEGLMDRFTDTPSITVIDITCEGNLANVTLDNTGDRNTDADPVNVYLYESQDLVTSTTKDLSGKAFAEADGRDFAEINFSAYMKSDTFYSVDIEFIDDGYTVETNCVAEPFTVGEVGAVFTENDTWEQVSFRKRYVDPVIVGSTNTKDSTNASGFTQNPLIPQVKNVSADSAWMRLCDHDDSDGCADHGDEIMGYIAVDAAALDIINETAAGTETVPASSGENGGFVSFGDAEGDGFQGDPVVFVTANTNNNETASGAWGEFSTWVNVSNATSTGFSLTRCNHNETSPHHYCEGHGNSEDIGWFAVSPDHMALLGTAAGFTSALSDDEWGNIDITSYGFDRAPVALAAIQGNRGGEDPKVSEARAGNTSAIEVRFCEHDDKDRCDTEHAPNFVAWLAAEQGELMANDSFIP